MTAKTSDNEFFSPDIQDSFWAALDPDLRKCLDNFEQGESWTYKYDELPVLFTDLAKNLPKVVVLPVTSRNKKILHELIPLIASMPFRQCVSAISWLDNHNFDEKTLGWGVVLFMENSDIRTNGHESKELYLQAKVINERINTLLKFNVVTKLFTNISPDESQFQQ